MADGHSLIQAIAQASGNAGGSHSLLEAMRFLAMYRAIQAHDEKVVFAAQVQTEAKVHPWDGLLD